jgi:hypothetical protein
MIEKWFAEFRTILESHAPDGRFEDWVIDDIIERVYQLTDREFKK